MVREFVLAIMTFSTYYLFRSKDGKDMKIGGRIKQLWEDEESVTLIVKNVTEMDAGTYKVKAKNDLGEVESTCKMIIRCNFF